MPSPFLPNRDADLLSWGQTFASGITTAFAAVGLTSAQSAAFITVNSAFASAYGISIVPATRTKATVSAKDVARTAMKGMARDLSRIIQAYPPVTNAQRINLGLTPRGGTVSPINPPTEAPVLEILSTQGRTIRLRLHAIGSDRRGKPIHVSGASVFSFVGAVPPPALSAWTFEGNNTRASFDLVFASTVPAGSQVWLMASWFNPRTQSGPTCTPLSAYIAGGVAMAA